MTPAELEAFVRDQIQGAERSNETYKKRDDDHNARFWEGYGSAMHVVLQKLQRS